MPDRFTLRSIKYLEHFSCKACIALSDSARRIQENMLDHMFLNPSTVQTIKNKIHIIYQPQEPLITEMEIEKKYENISSCVEFVFLGRILFKKGEGNW